MRILAGNWKMNKTSEEARVFLSAFSSLDKGDASVIIFPPFTSLSVVAESGVPFGAQDIYPGDGGAFTGEVSGPMLKEIGCTYVLVGHSERRQLFNDDDALVNRKVLSGLSSGLKIVLCVGETLDEHESGKAQDVVKDQLVKGLHGVEDGSSLMIAYEPIWAIGTGKCSTPENAEEMHRFIRGWLSERFGDEKIPVLYGGSANPENAAGLLEQEHVDGLLVGGASLDPEKFAKMCRS